MKGRLTNPLLFAWLTITLAAVTAPALTEQQNPQLTKLTDVELKDLAISLERTSCYGDCPAYKVTIYGDGRVEYEGRKNVQLTNKNEGRLQPGDLKKILSAFDKANYFSINSYTYDNCSCTICSDMPTAITEIHARGLSHRVQHYHGCRCAPKELWELEETLDQIVHTEQWTGDVSERGPKGTTCWNKKKI